MTFRAAPGTAAVLAFLAAAPPAGALGGEGEQALSAGLAAVEALLAEDEWDDARRDLDALLAEHAAADHAVLARPRIVELLRRAVFLADYDEPDPGTLVSGTLRKYSASTGQVRLRYGPDQLQDFVVVREDGEVVLDFEGEVEPDDFLLHPALFAGSYRLEVRAARYEATSEVIPSVLCMLEPYQWLVVGLGKPGVGRLAVPAFVLRFSEEGGELLDRAESPAEVYEPYEFEVRMGRRDVEVYFDRRRVLRAKKERDLYGQVGFGGIRGLREIEIFGVAQRSWMQGLLDSEFHRRYREFLEDLDENELLPEWLRVDEVDEEADIFLDEFPGPEREGQVDEAREALRMLREEGLEAGLEYAHGLDDTATSEVFREHLLAVLHHYGGDFDEALVHCGRVRELAPDFLPAAILQAFSLAWQGSFGAGIVLLEDLLVRDPEDARLYATLALLELLDGHAGDAEDVLREAIRQGLYDGTLDLVNGMRTKAVSGPTWPQRFEHVTEHFVVASDIDNRTCLEAADILETALEHYERRMVPLPDDGRRFRVYLFSGQLGYLHYTADALFFPAEHTAGVYSPRIEQLLIWNTPDRRDMLETVRHEGLHQYLDRLAKNAPVWLHEGLAEYWEGADFTKSRSRQIRVEEDHVKLLRAAEELTPLEELVRLDHAGFREKPWLHYPESWAFVHFLLEGPSGNRRLFDELLERLCAGEDPGEATEKTFEDVDWSALGRGFEAHVSELARGL